MSSGALVLAALDAIGRVIWHSMLQVLPAEGCADGCRRRSVAGAGEIAASDGSGYGRWRQRCDGHELSSPMDGIGHSRGWQPGSKVSMMIIRPPQQGQAFHWLSSWGFSVPSLSPLDGGGSGTPSSRRANAILPARLPLAKRP